MSEVEEIEKAIDFFKTCKDNCSIEAQIINYDQAIVALYERLDRVKCFNVKSSEDEKSTLDKSGKCKMRLCNKCDSYRKQLGKMNCVSVKDKLPNQETNVLALFDDGFVASVYYSENFHLWANSGEVVAWMLLSEIQTYFMRCLDE